MRPHGRATVNVKQPRAFAVCDRCGFLYNHHQLKWQMDWRGPMLQNLRILVCPTCYDMAQEQLKTIVLPADPIPIMNARPENYTDADNPLSTIYNNIGSLIQGGGLAAAFDSNRIKPFQTSARIATSVSSYQNSVGKNWGTNNTQTVTRFVLTAPNNSPFSSAGAVSFKLQGSNNGLVFTDLYTATSSGSNGEKIDVTITAGPFQYHRINFFGDGTSAISVAQCSFYVMGTQSP